MNGYYVTLKSHADTFETWVSADTMADAMQEARDEFRQLIWNRGDTYAATRPISAACRKSHYKEWVCDNWTIAGHVPHNKHEEV